jgi:murein DD-endopeptidase MepM/ murein hydrolase activator NlpD
MKLLYTLCALTVLNIGVSQVSAQNNLFVPEENNEANPCITKAEYAVIEQRIYENAKQTGHDLNKPSAPLLLNWPLREAPGFNDCSYYFIAAHVDQDTLTSAFKDYNCGTITYNGHRGTDIAIEPFPFYKMDNNQVQVIAAAAGTIINKHDGEFDRNCLSSGSNVTANYLIIQHADGSVALYWHMKKNSLTNKVVGQTVALGEYLGVVGSSGSSSGPHLHFEVWANTKSSSLIDPFSGSCNILNAASWWAAQKPYIEPAVVKASVHTTDITFPACGTTEVLNESNVFVIPFQGNGLTAGYAKFYAFLRNAVAGDTVFMRILNPDASVFTNWQYVIPAPNNFSYLNYSKKLPTITGTYIFQATYKGVTCAQNFDIRTCADNYTEWFGSTDINWSNAANWCCGSVPDSTTNVIIYSGVPNYPVVNVDAACRSIKIQPSANVKVNTGFKLKVYH